MLVISDASPIIALDDIGKLFLLKELFGRVVVTDVVRDEILVELPKWIEVVKDYDQTAYLSLKQELDPGEASAIILATKTLDCLLIMDEKKGRKVAVDMGLKVTGLLGIVIESKQVGLIDSGSEMLEALEEHGFWLSKKLKNRVLEKLGE